MKLRTFLIVLCLFALGGGAILLWRNSQTSIEISPEVLARDYVRIPGVNGLRGVDSVKLWKYYWDQLPEGLHISIKPAARTPFTNVVSSLVSITRRPIYVHREIASLAIGELHASAYTYEGLVRKLEAAFLTNGIVSKHERNLDVTVMMKKPGFVLTSNMFDLGLEVPDEIAFGERSPRHPDVLEKLPEQIAKSIPKLKLVKQDDPAQLQLEGLWHSKEIGRAHFALRDRPRFRPLGTSPNPTSPLPTVDLVLTAIHFDSPDQAEIAVKRSLMMRSAAVERKEAYKGASLHKYLNASGEVSVAICSYGLYVIEIGTTEGNTKLSMNVLDAALAELGR